ncbi:MAG: hypothetical protein MUF15_13590 [Acidobacteria bacterium]|jgi:hypothetical protein|nr:hypothetical protein [Acidobacteriota bacterium]
MSGFHSLIIKEFQPRAILIVLVQLIKRSESLETKKTRSLLDLSGLGKEIWETIDAEFTWNRKEIRGDN